MYFELEQDKRIRNRFRFRDIESTVRGEFEPEEFNQIQDISVLFTLGDKDSVYPDVVAGISGVRRVKKTAIRL